MSVRASFTPETNAPPRKAPNLRLVAKDREFLPAALEILETPPSPVRIAILLAICAFVVAALGWSWFGRLDIIATAPGKVHPVGRIKVIQPLETGKVVAIAVHDGQAVKAGETLIELDPSSAQADETAASAALESYGAEVARRLAELSAVRSKQLSETETIDWPTDVPETIMAREQRVFSADVGDLAASIANLQAQAQQKKDEQASLEATIAAEKQLIGTDATRVQMKTQLFGDRNGTKADVVNATETLQYQQMTLAQNEDQLGQARAGEVVAERAIDAAYTKFLSDNAQKLEDAERQVDDLRQKLVKARTALGSMTLRSPIDGTVQASTVTTIGQVLQAGSEVMRVVPANADLDIEAYLPDSDRGFVEVGNEAVIKVASFPFTRYGTINAKVVDVARDAIPAAEAKQAESDPTLAHKDDQVAGSEPTQNLVYPVTLRLERTSMNIDGANVPLAPGMAVTAEIRTGSRRILEYVFSPLAETASQAMKER